MINILESVKDLIKINPLVIDSTVSRLHYKFTVLVLIVFSILVTAKQYVGDPIECHFEEKNDATIKALNTFCWIHSTYSIESAWLKEVGTEVVYPGVAKYTPEETKVYHPYYQWVCFVLCLQAILFYLPRYLWKIWEGGHVKSLILGLDSPVLTQDYKDSKRKILADYLCQCLGYNTWYGRKFMFCELLYLINIIGQQFLMNVFLGKGFSTYGTRVVEFHFWNSSVAYNPMIHLFPRMTKCTYHDYGNTGDVQSKDGLCILPINILNEKIFIFLWFWFILLSCFTGIKILYQFCLMFSQTFRLWAMKSKTPFCRADYLRIVVKRCSFSDWILLDLLSKNLDHLNFCDLMNDLALQILQKPNKKAIKRKYVNQEIIFEV